MTVSGRPGPPRVALATHGDGALHLVSRAADDSLLHARELGGWSAHRLPCKLAGDPSIVATTTGAVHVFARGRGSKLLHWRFDPEARTLVAIDHGWRVAYDPVAGIGPTGAVGAFAHGYGDTLLRWWSADGEHWGEVEDLGGQTFWDPATVLRAGGEGPEVVVCNSAGLSHWGPVRVEPMSELVYEQRWKNVLGSTPTGTPVMVSWGPLRLDVLAPMSPDPSSPLPHGQVADVGHWGRKGGESAASWFGVDPMTRATSYTGPVCAVSTGPSRAMAYARDGEHRLAEWLWAPFPATGGIGDPFGWEGPQPPFDVSVPNPRGIESLPAIGSQPAAVVRDGRVHVYAWDELGLELVELVRDATEAPSTDPQHPFKLLVTETWTSNVPPLSWPDPAFVLGAPQRRLPVTVDVLLGRAADQVTLGVSWQGLQLVDGDPPRLVPTAEAGLLELALPPQHVAEEVFTGVGTPVPPVTGHSEFGTWQSVLSGPSHLVVEVTSEVELTTAGILAAVAGAPLRVNAEGASAPFTEIELPWQLFLSPDGATAAHLADDPDPAAGVVPLWRSRLRSPESPTTPLRVLGSAGADPFEMPLGRGARDALRAASGPAVADRLEVSGLGGTLMARGAWTGLEWEHQAVLGRDHRVRVLMEGMLYPFGHRAQYLEVSERFPPEPDTEPIAAVRKRRVLSVSQPVREYDGLRAFPFDRVTLTTTEVDGLDSPDAIRQPGQPKMQTHAPGWQGRMRQRRPPEALIDELEAQRAVLVSMPPMEAGSDGVPPLVEREAVAAAGPDPLPFVAEANRRLRLVEALLDLEQQVEFIQEDEDEFVNEFFCPRRGGRWVEFPVTAQTGDVTVSFAVPLLFVRDVNVPQSATMEAFDSFDPDIAEPLHLRLAQNWAELRAQDFDGADPADPDNVCAGVVPVPGTPVDLVRAAPEQRKPEDVHVVHALHISGVTVGRDVLPRLGPPPGVEVVGPQWAADIALPALRSLLPDQPEAHRALVAFTQEFESVGDAVDVALRIAQTGVQHAQNTAVGLLVDFTKHTDRSGGLAAPKIAADAISRVAGPLNLEGLTDPSKLFDEGASLLGVSLLELLREVPVSEELRPSITTDLTGAQPVVRLDWPERPLGVSAPFGRKVTQSPPPPTIELKVTSTGSEVSSWCRVAEFSLTFPAGDPLIILNVDSIVYEQKAGRPPDISIDGLDVQFAGALDLLQSLQGETKGLKDTGPTLEVNEKGITAAYAMPIPDVSSGAFVLRNVTFGAKVVVPFQGDPVSVAIGFASREKPFNLSVMALGGGGYVDVEVTGKGLRRLDVSLEFGASVAVDFIVASGEAHVLGGIRFQLLPDDSVELVGYLRIGGSLEILGLITVSVELVLSLGYQSKGNKLVGRATLILELDLTIYSDSVEIDSGDWTIAGGDEPTFASRPRPTRDDYAALWNQHRVVHGGQR
jgi:hypothetical protein